MVIVRRDRGVEVPQRVLQMCFHAPLRHRHRVVAVPVPGVGQAAAVIVRGDRGAEVPRRVLQIRFHARLRHRYRVAAVPVLAVAL